MVAMTPSEAEEQARKIVDQFGIRAIEHTDYDAPPALIGKIKAALLRAASEATEREREECAQWHQDTADGLRMGADKIIEEWTGPDYSDEENRVNRRDAIEHRDRAAFHDRCAVYFRARSALGRKFNSPYKEWCRKPEACAGKGYCPLNPTCGD